MNRAAFMRGVHGLAEQLGGRLYRIVSKQGELVRAQALRQAKAQLRASMEGTTDGHAQEVDGPVAVVAEPEDRAAAREPVPAVARRRRSRVEDRAGGEEPDHHDRDGDQPRAPRAKGKRGPQRCRTCVEAGRSGLGHNAKTCGRESSTSESDPEEESAGPVPVDVPPSTPSPPPPTGSSSTAPQSRAARFARIEAAARARADAEAEAS